MARGAAKFGPKTSTVPLFVRLLVASWSGYEAAVRTVLTETASPVVLPFSVATCFTVLTGKKMGLLTDMLLVARMPARFKRADVGSNEHPKVQNSV